MAQHGLPKPLKKAWDLAPRVSLSSSPQGDNIRSDCSCLGKVFFTSTKKALWRARNQQNHHSALRSRNLRPLRKSWHGSAVVAWTRNPGPSQICAQRCSNKSASDFRCTWHANFIKQSESAVETTFYICQFGVLAFLVGFKVRRVHTCLQSSATREIRKSRES